MSNRPAPPEEDGEGKKRFRSSYGFRWIFQSLLWGHGQITRILPSLIKQGQDSREEPAGARRCQQVQNLDNGDSRLVANDSMLMLNSMLLSS